MLKTSIEIQYDKKYLIIKFLFPHEQYHISEKNLHELYLIIFQMLDLYIIQIDMNEVLRFQLNQKETIVG